MQALLLVLDCDSKGLIIGFVLWRYWLRMVPTGAPAAAGTGASFASGLFGSSTASGGLFGTSSGGAGALVKWRLMSSWWSLLDSWYFSKALAIGVLTSSIGVRVRRFCGFVLGEGLSGRVSSEVSSHVCVLSEVSSDVCMGDGSQLFLDSFWVGQAGRKIDDTFPCYLGSMNSLLIYF